MVNFKVFGAKLQIYPQTAKFGFKGGIWEIWELWEIWEVWEIWEL